jgi:hypothetical protein
VALTGAAVSPEKIWRTIVREAARESALWAAALRPPDEREAVPVFSPLGAERFALGIESIYEGYLLHYGRARFFNPPDWDTTILLGDYLYAHGLVRIAALGEVEVVADLAELLSLCAQLRAEPTHRTVRTDGFVWAATVALLGRDDERLEDARVALRDSGDPAPLARLAAGEAGAEAVAGALARHVPRIGYGERKM